MADSYEHPSAGRRQFVGTMLFRFRVAWIERGGDLSAAARNSNLARFVQQRSFETASSKIPDWSFRVGARGTRAISPAFSKKLGRGGGPIGALLNRHFAFDV